MSLNAVSSQVVTQVYSRLSDPVGGFNPGIVANAANYNLPTNFIVVDWSTSSANFVFGQVDPLLVEKSGIITYPWAALYIRESANTNIQKFNQFSGQVRCVFDVYLSWIPIKGLQNFDAYPNCVEDVVLDVINRVENQDWAMPVVYNGQIQSKRGPVIYGANNWKQQIGFSMIFEVHQ